MNPVRMGVIGTGGMGRAHLSYYPEVEGLQLTAVADIDRRVADEMAEHCKVQGFYSGEELLASGLVDAVCIATPHYFHPPLASEAFRRGIHVLSEKPIGVDKKSVQAMLAVHQQHPQLVYSIMFQMRTVPRFIRLREMIQRGELGQLVRIHWTVSSWFRPQVYYDSGTWRATWQGEGGGVLINQCVHNLDIWQWLFGLPERITAQLSLGKYHNIEVEDEVTAYMEYANGATALFVTSTGEHPGTDRLEVCGELGKVVIEGAQFTFYHNLEPTSEFSRRTPASFSRPAMETITLQPAELPGAGGHKRITQNFIAAIQGREELIVHGAEGLASLELINAMTLSGLRHRPVELPVDAEAFDQLLTELKAGSKVKTQAVQAQVDMGASFHA